MVDISIDKSRAVRVRARTGEDSVPKTFTFTNSDGSAHDISSYDFKIFVQVRANSTVKLFTLSVGSGLSIQGADSNQLLIQVTKEQATQKADTYFWRMYSALEDHTWLNGPWEFHNGEYDAVVEDTPIEIKQDGDPITIQVVGSGGASGITTFDQQ